jgi:hypothetical protein
MSLGTSSRSAVVVAALILSACGGSAIPRAENASAVAAISGAEAAGAGQVPQAALYLKMAKDGVARGEKQVSDGEEDEARDTFERATADGDLARALTTEQQAREEADAATQRVERLRLQTTTF